jgi:uncharacterized protein
MDALLQDLSTPAEVIRKLELEKVPVGSIRRFWLHIVTDGMSVPVHVPVIVARGKKDGPVFGVTAAVRGNEINGIPLIQRLFSEIDLDTLSGFVVGVPVVNVPSFLLRERNYLDGSDLNAIMPGKANGSNGPLYAFRIMDRLIKYFHYLLDFHTASFGRINAHYIRADLNNRICREMAILQNAQVIVHNEPADGSLRGAANALGIFAINLEIGSPHTFQKGFLKTGLVGINNVLCNLGMIPGALELPEAKAYLCRNSYWLYTDSGGLLSVSPNVGELVFKGETIATLRNIFGDIIREYQAPEDGIVVGKSVDPVNQTGGRILHLGTF